MPSIATKINDLGWPWIDLERPLCALLHYTCLSEPTTKIWMKIDPYYQWQKCRSGIPVYSKIRFMRIFSGGSLDRDVKWEWGRFFSAIFSQYVAISRNTVHFRQAIEWCHFRCPWVIRDPDFKRRAGLSAKAGLSVFTAQCTLVHLRGLGIACRPSVCLSVRL